MTIKLIQKDSYMYSSKLTLKYIGSYMQEIFKNTVVCFFLSFLFVKNAVINAIRIVITSFNISIKFCSIVSPIPGIYITAYFYYSIPRTLYTASSGVL